MNNGQAPHSPDVVDALSALALSSDKVPARTSNEANRVPFEGVKESLTELDSEITPGSWRVLFGGQQSNVVTAAAAKPVGSFPGEVGVSLGKPITQVPIALSLSIGSQHPESDRMLLSPPSASLATTKPVSEHLSYLAVAASASAATPLGPSSGGHMTSVKDLEGHWDGPAFSQYCAMTPPPPPPPPRKLSTLQPPHSGEVASLRSFATVVVEGAKNPLPPPPPPPSSPESQRIAGSRSQSTGQQPKGQSKRAAQKAASSSSSPGGKTRTAASSKKMDSKGGSADSKAPSRGGDGGGGSTKATPTKKSQRAREIPSPQEASPPLVPLFNIETTTHRIGGGFNVRSQGQHLSPINQQQVDLPQSLWLQQHLVHTSEEAFDTQTSSSGHAGRTTQPALDADALSSPFKVTGSGQEMTTVWGPAIPSSSDVSGGQLLGTFATGATNLPATTMVRKAAWWESPVLSQPWSNITSQQTPMQTLVQQAPMHVPENFHPEQHFSGYFSVFDYTSTASATAGNFQQYTAADSIPGNRLNSGQQQDIGRDGAKG